MDELGDDIQAKLDSLKPQESPYAKYLRNLIGSPGSDTAKYDPVPDVSPMGQVTKGKGNFYASFGIPHDDHTDYKIGHDEGYVRPPRKPSSHRRRV